MMKPENTTEFKVATKMGVCGEYRYELRGPDGRIKQSCDWTPNMILDNGLWVMIQNSNACIDMALGTSDAPVVETQTGIQGSLLGHQGNGYGGGSHTGAPEYGAYTSVPYDFVGGNATGLIKEFILTHQQNPSELQAQTLGNIRVVLTNPINKGVQDTLKITHRLYNYQEMNDISGTVDIIVDGVPVSYDWTMRPYGVTQFYGWETHRGPLGLFAGENATFAYQVPPVLNDILDYAITSDEAWGASGGADATTYGGTLPTYWREMHTFLNVDWGNDYPFNKMYCTTQNAFTGGAWKSRGRQWTLTRTSDGAPFTKEDTHEFRFTYRTYISRYVP